MPTFDFATIMSAVGGLVKWVFGLLPTLAAFVWRAAVSNPLLTACVSAFGAGFLVQTASAFSKENGSFNIIGIVVSTLVGRFSRALSNLFKFW